MAYRSDVTFVLGVRRFFFSRFNIELRCSQLNSNWIPIANICRNDSIMANRVYWFYCGPRPIRIAIASIKRTRQVWLQIIGDLIKIDIIRDQINNIKNQLRSCDRTTKFSQFIVSQRRLNRQTCIANCLFSSNFHLIHHLVASTNAIDHLIEKSWN